MSQPHTSPRPSATHADTGAVPAGGLPDHEPDGQPSTDLLERVTAATARAQVLRAQADALIERAAMRIVQSEQRMSRRDRATARSDPPPRRRIATGTPRAAVDRAPAKARNRRASNGHPRFHRAGRVYPSLRIPGERHRDTPSPPARRRGAGSW
jgi:hypothetical protein